MAKARAICNCKYCGNQFEKTVTKYNRSEADFWESWAKNYYDECPECKEKRIQNERILASEKAAKEAQELNLLILNGSEKQIAWAETIRMKFINVWDEYTKETTNKKTIIVFNKFKKWMLSHVDSKYWIDNRDNFDYGGSFIVRQFKSDFNDYVHNKKQKNTEENES